MAHLDVTLMDKYTYLITQCQEVAHTVKELEEGATHVDEVLKKYKFRVRHVEDPLVQEVACIIDNYRAFIKK